MQSEESERAYVEACAQIAAGDVAGAVAGLSEAVEVDPDAARLWALRGVAQWELGEVSASIASLETALTLAPLGAEGRLSLALGYEVIQKRALATDLFVALSKEEDLPNRVLEPLARALGRADLPDEALRVCTRAAIVSPTEVAPLRGMAYYLAKLGAPPEKMLPVLFRAFHLDPNDFDTRILLARRLRECDRSKEAAILLSVVDIESSCCAKCLHAMREIFVEAGDAENAARCIAALVATAESHDPQGTG